MASSEIITVQTTSLTCHSCGAGMECELYRETGAGRTRPLWHCKYNCGGHASQTQADDAILDQVDFYGPAVQIITEAGN